MDGTRMMSTDISFNINVGEFDTLNGLTRKRCVNYLMDKLQEGLDAMSFSNIHVLNFLLQSKSFSHCNLSALLYLS